MGSISINGKCLLTSLPAEDVALGNSNWEGYEYKIKPNNKDYILHLPLKATDWFSNDYFKRNRHLIAGLLLNDNWISDELNMIEDITFFKKVLDNRDYPITPKQKRDFLFYKIFQSISFAGDEYRIQRLKNDFIPFNYYMVNHKELHFYLFSLQENGLIDISDTSDYYDIELTYEGLNYGILLQEEGELSDNCFIAMAFNDHTLELRSAIKEAVIQTGFRPILVDEKQIDSDKTINDEIINSIKKSNFCIADFSFHSNGVYFESGYALGQGKKVIYICSEEEFKKAHFDIRPLQHIIYSDLAKLKNDLTNKIEVWIKK